MAFSMAWQGTGAGDEAGDEAGGGSPVRLAAFRSALYGSLTRRADALFELADAVLCGTGPVTDLARLSLVPEFRRGHGALHDAVNAGRIQIRWLGRALAGLPLPAWRDGRIRLAVDVSNWLRPDAETSPERAFCHVAGKGKNDGTRVPGWPYSFVAALSPGASSWTMPLDAVRLGPGDDDGAVTAAQVREVVGRLVDAGHWTEGDPDIIVVFDAGFNLTRLTWLLQDLPVLVIGRVRSNRVCHRPAPPKTPGTGGPQAKHGPLLHCDNPASWQDPAVTQEGGRPGQEPVQVTAWHRMHPQVHRRTGGFEDWPEDEDLPVIEGTLIRLSAPGRTEPMWLWAADPAAGDHLLRVIWQAYLRRFDLEHTFRFLKQKLGWTRPLLRDPAAADRWTWLLLACYAQLWLARDLAEITRLPWQPHQTPQTMTPGRVLAGFRCARETAGTPARTAKPATPGPGRPKGSKNKRKPPSYPVGKTAPKQQTAKNPRKKTEQTG